MDALLTTLRRNREAVVLISHDKWDLDDPNHDNVPFYAQQVNREIANRVMKEKVPTEMQSEYRQICLDERYKELSERIRKLKEDNSGCK